MAYIIAEVGVNHNGQLQIALDLIEKAKEAVLNSKHLKPIKLSLKRLQKQTIN